MKSLTLLAVAAAAVALPAASAQAQTQAQNAGGQSTSSSAITRSLNQAPPSAMAPATPRDEDQVSTRPVAAPAIEPARTPAAQTPRAQAPQAQTTPAPAQAQGPAQAQTRPATAPASSPAATPRPTTETPPGPTPETTAEPAPEPEPAPLDAAAIAALPFRVDLPAGTTITAARPGPDFRIWSVRKAGRTLAMIYAGPASQFPIYDGQQVQAAGRTSVVVTEEGQRLALEHLFQRDAAPREIHVWVASVDGADRVLAERLAQSVDPR